MTYQNIIDYWYDERIKNKWFNATKSLDQEMKLKYLPTYQQAKNGLLEDWRQTPLGCLALVIVLDQLPLNIFRGKVASFDTQKKAIALSYFAIKKGFDKKLSTEYLIFLFMPLMHSEDINDQLLSVELCQKYRLSNLEFANHHYNIIKQFGRFPHRNKILDRTSTVTEIAYLNSDNAFLG